MIEELWAFRPNWASPVEERVSFRTEIIRSENGREQRIAQRVNPRVRFSFEALLNRGSFRQAALQLSEQQSRRSYLQHPRHKLKTTSTVAAGSSLLPNVGSSPWWLQPGANVVLQNASGDRELLLLNSSSQPTTPLVYGHEAGSFLALAVPGWVSGDASLNLFTDRVAELPLEFDADPIWGVHRDFGEAPESYNGAEFFSYRPNWARGVSLSLEQEATKIDLLRGAVDFYRAIAFTGRTTQFSFLVKNDEDYARLAGLFYRCKGQQKSFYAPTWSDVAIPAETGPIGSVLVVAGEDIAAVFNESTMYRHLRLRTSTGAEEVVRVTSASSLAGTTTLSFDRSLSIAAETVSAIDWVVRQRFSTDRLTLRWSTDGVAQATCTFTALEDDG